MLKRLALVVATAAALTATPRPAAADWLFTPYLGVTFGGDTVSPHVAYGLSAGWMGAGIIGFEVDAAIAPDFLDTDNDVEFGFTESSATTLMANLIVGAPLGAPGVRPYVSGGAGLLRTSVSDLDGFFEIDDNSFGVNVGAGIIAFVQENVGLRGDVRYFRSVQDADPGGGIDLDLGGFDFWRGTVGVTFRF